MFVFIYASSCDIASVNCKYSYMNAGPKNFHLLFIFALSVYVLYNVKTLTV